jgi:hypothetical protein
MTNTNWYAEASLSCETHVFAAGSLAQCVRRWVRLTEHHRAGTQIRMGGRTGQIVAGLPILGQAEITALARNPDLGKV